MMDGAAAVLALELAPAQLGRLMPMSLWLEGDGRLRWAGPTIAKLCPAGIAGMRFFEVFELRRPRGIASMAQLAGVAGQRLQLALRGGAGTTFRGLAVALSGGGGAPGAGMIVNLSFGVALTDAVAAHGLTDTDFAPTDPTVEMLYLAEAKTAVAAELRRLNAELARAKAEAEAQALTDTLTGLANRRAMDLALDRATRGRLPFALMQLDLDHFKQVNDVLGHAAGDHVLQRVGQVLAEETRAGDVVARVGGDEFVVILSGTADPAQVAQVAARIIARLSQPIPYQGATCHISASIGTTMSDLYARPEPDRMLNDADRALYHSKNAGRGRASAHLEGPGSA